MWTPRLPREDYIPPIHKNLNLKPESLLAVCLLYSVLQSSKITINSYVLNEKKIKIDEGLITEAGTSEL